MDELGHILREARETKGFTLEDVQEEIRINAKYLKSLEIGDYSALPTPVHVRGFLRNYARFLGLDPQPLLDRYESNLNRQPAKSVAPTKSSDGAKNLPSIDFESPVFYDPVNVEVDVGQRRDPESALRLIIIIALVVAVALIANRFVPLLMGNGDGSTAITDGINDALLNITNRAEATATAVAEGEATPTSPGQQPIFVPGDVITSTSRNNFSTTLTPAPTRPSLPANLEEINLRLDISERTWMEVTIDGDVVFSGWAKNGDPPYEWTAAEEAKVNTGNAVGVFVTINDISWGRMGNRGENKEEVWRTTN